jgi:3-oxoacyl-[acyl-carrier protein] reductase
MIEPALHDKVALVTGANHGIGAAIARALAAQGAAVVIHYFDPTGTSHEDDDAYTPLHIHKGRDAAAALVREIETLGGRAAAIASDLSDPAVVPQLFDRAEEQLGPVDILVNNAAHCEEPDTIFTIGPGTLDRTFAVNVRAGVLLIAEYVRRFQQRGGSGGRIINLSTDAAQTFAGQISYGASKATMEAFTRSIAIEVGPLDITVNTVAPGPVQTGWMRKEQVERITPHIPLGRVGTPDDIADAVLFLASAQARWLTGNVIKVSGGHEI